MYDNVQVIIPSLNPDEKLAKTAAGMIEKGFTDIVLVDDGSDEAHRGEFGKIKEAYPDNVTVLVHEVNKGKGRALKTAFSYILDNMPEATGLKLAEALRTLKFPPNVVFVTAYSEYALEAFEVNAVDYLVKPVETERLAQALARVRENVALHMQAQKSERISVEKGGKKILISIDSIRFVMARDDYAYLQTDTDRYFSTVSLAQLEKRLDGHGFFRVHRGYLVNLLMVEEVEPVSGGTLLLTLNGVSDKIPVSRRRVSLLKKALGI